MVTRHVRGKITWVDIEAPTHDELAEVMHEFDIDARVEDEIISPTPYPITVTFPNYVYLILHFPTVDPHGGVKSQEIDFIAGKNFLITARYEVIDSIHNLHKIFEAEELLGLRKTPEHSDLLIERIMRRLYAAITSEIEDVARRLERIERDIFSGKERETVRAISDINRTFLRFDTTLDRHEEPLTSFLQSLTDSSFFGASFKEHVMHIMAERDHASGLVGSYRAAARELRITNDSLLSSTQNEVMKKLTVMAFMAFPLTFIAGLFGMNVEHMPIIGSPHSFWIIIGIMVSTVVAMSIYFRYKRWL